MAEKLDQHQLICELKDHAIELGRTPTRDEFVKRIKQRQVLDELGGYAVLCQAAGLDGAGRVRKLTSAIFERHVAEVIAQHEPIAPIPQANYTKTLCIGDTHFPFVSQRVLDFIYEWAEKNKPRRIVQIGDLYDMYCASKFPRSQNVYSPEEEETLARHGAETMWSTLRRICPEAECVQLKGNHDIRPLKRTLESAPSLEHVIAKHLDHLMTFDGVKLIVDPRQEYIVDGIQFIHGYRSKLGDHRDYTLMHTVCGHSHVGGVTFKRLRGQTLWELNCGYAGDPESKALGYTPQRLTHWTHGLGAIDELGPRFVSL